MHSTRTSLSARLALLIAMQLGLAAASHAAEPSVAVVSAPASASAPSPVRPALAGQAARTGHLAIANTSTAAPGLCQAGKQEPAATPALCTPPQKADAANTAADTVAQRRIKAGAGRY